MNNIISDIYISCVRCAGKNKNYVKKKLNTKQEGVLLFVIVKLFHCYS